ncbi:hypothetical protein WA1_25420 [Scytonema hofmannii PCC 7110]|uniref:Uncharacterized protein n=1 Tax=Scytonema hofmannii PCC 7110 TaxID=128403 RepID=A0A139X8E4_9CYAN|nr:hypothetical protein [Scytonema hofmannii]KYC40956.1 hypothetical protein WA1_25420 [Scytonema hofmannii PCC 7110]
MAHLVYPTIDLFLYDLRDALGQSTSKVGENRQSFFQKLPTNIHFPILKKDEEFQIESEAEFVELLGEEQITPLDLKSQDYEGYYYPVRLSDTYGLLVDCSVADKTSPYPISSIKILRNLIFQSINYQRANLGETWLISGIMPKTTKNENSESIARECYQTLISNANWQKNLQGKGAIFGGKIFELRQSNFRNLETPATIEDRIEDNHHVIIIIYPDEITAEKSSDLIDDWLRLLCYRNKIIWAYNESRKIKTYLKKDFIDVQDYISLVRKKESDKITLKQLQKNLDKAEYLFSQYTIDLNYLDYQSNTIEVNLYNYSQRLKTILENSTAKGIQSDLEFLNKFSQQVQEKYVRQLQKDYHNLRKGLEMLQIAVNFIRAEVEVDRAQSAQNFQNTVAIIGVGLTAGSMVASLEKLGEGNTDPVSIVLSKYLGNPTPKPWWFDPAIPFIYGISAAIAAAVLTWLAIRLWAIKK